MYIFLEILKFTIPALIVFLTAFFILREFFRNEDNNRKLKMKTESGKMITPVRLQAYERIVLFLERMNPENLILRVSRPEMTAAQLKVQMLKSIREEFEHNLSQQLYVSKKSWDWVKNSKEEMISIVNTAATKLDSESTAAGLGQAILEISLEKEMLALNKALELVKSEIQELF